MSKINFISSNRKKSVLITLAITLFGLVVVCVPLIFMQLIPLSMIGTFLKINSKLILLAIPILFYFIYTGVFIHNIKIDSYVIVISSYRSISSLFSKKDYIDISHAMLYDFSFFNRSFSLNKTLMLKIKKENNKIVAKRFTLTLLSSKEEEEIRTILSSILLKNNGK